MTARGVSPVLVGRVDEMAALEAAYGRAVVDRAAVVLVSGEAGIGKTRLVEEFVAGLDGRVRVLTGGCLELGADGVPFAPFVGVLRQLVHDVGAERVTALLPGIERGLGRWLPGIGESTEVEETVLCRGRLFAEMLSLLDVVAAESPVVLVLEDLHWADPSSRELLVYLIRNLSRPGVLLLGTYRSTDVDSAHPLRHLVAELARMPRVHLVELVRLTRTEVERQLAGILGRRPDPALVTRVHKRSDGNPLFVEALSDGGVTTPATVRNLLLAGLAFVPGDGRRVLAAAAVAGGHVRHSLLAELVHLEDLVLEDVVRELVDRHVLVPVDDGYAFRHALIREAVYQELLPGERVRLHTSCAETLNERPALAADGRALAEIAAHWHAAGRHAEALDAAWRAAGQARSAYAYEGQLWMLERILELWHSVPDAQAQLGADHATVLTMGAEACFGSGEVERGVTLATDALTEIDSRAEPERAARVLQLRSQLKQRVDIGGHADLEAALRLLPTDQSSAVRGQVLASLARFFVAVGDHDRARPVAEAAHRAGRRTGDPATIALALLSSAAVQARDGQLYPAIVSFNHARRAAQDAGDDEILLTTIAWECDALFFHGEYDRAVACARHGCAKARNLGMERTRGVVLACKLAEALIRLGRWAEAREVADEALACDPPPLHRGVLMFDLGVIAFVRGDLDEAARAAAVVAAMADDPRTDDSWADSFFVTRHLLECWLALSRHEPEAADRRLGRLLTEQDLTTKSDDGWRLLVLGIEIQQARRAAAGRDPELTASITRRECELLRLSQKLTVRSRLQAAHRATSLAFVNDADAQAWDEVSIRWRDIRSPFQVAQTLRLGAGAALAAGDRGGAEKRLREAATIAADLGAVPLVEEIELLARRGRIELDPEEPPPAPVTAADRLGLTSRELDVLRLVAQGHSNRRIGEELFISPSTAGVHVSHILAKLGVSTRVEAAAIAHRTGLAT